MESEDTHAKIHLKKIKRFEAGAIACIDGYLHGIEESESAQTMTALRDKKKNPMGGDWCRGYFAMMIMLYKEV